MKLVTSRDKYAKHVMKSNIKDGYPFLKELVAGEMGKTEIKMIKPVSLGQAWLDFSKTLMYKFQYDYMLPRYGSKAKLSYMDTDSPVHEIMTEDFFSEILQKM